MIARKTQKIIYNILILCFLIGGATYVCSRFIHLGNIEYTDNAQVKQHITPINTRVPGFIKKICFEEYQQVRKGDTLVIIEDAEFRLRVAQAEADSKSATLPRTHVEKPPDIQLYLYASAVQSRRCTEAMYGL